VVRLLRRESGSTYYYGEFAIITVRIVDGFPNPVEFGGVKIGVVELLPGVEQF
jgi:hypothetical protein